MDKHLAIARAMTTQPMYDDQGQTYNQNDNLKWDWSKSGTGKAVEALRNLIRAQTPPLKVDGTYAGPQMTVGAEDTFNPKNMNPAMVKMLLQLLGKSRMQNG